jgi:N-acetylmuramoyl-L-alanine amidase-like protein
MRTLTFLLAMPAALAACGGGTLRPETVETAAAPAPGPILGPEPIPRKAWNAAPTRPAAKPMGVPFRITVHHTGRPFTSAAAAITASKISAIQRDHQVRSGWADIAYHFVIDRAGRTWQGRVLSLQGAHAGNDAANRGNIGVCLLGNFDVQRPTPEQAEATRALILQLENRFRIGPESVFAHREVRAAHGLGSTGCPGRHLQSLVDELRRPDAPDSRGWTDRVATASRTPLELPEARDPAPCR